MKRLLITVALVCACLALAARAHAVTVVGPGFAVSVPVYAEPQVYVAPAYAPPPVYVGPPVYLPPRPVVVAPAAPWPGAVYVPGPGPRY